MIQPLKITHKTLEHNAALQRRKNPRGLPCGNGWYARKRDDQNWEMGVWTGRQIKNPAYTNYTGPEPYWLEQPFEKWVFLPLYLFKPGSVTWDPQKKQHSALRAFSRRQTNKAINSTIYAIPFTEKRWGNHTETQGGGLLTVEHYPASGLPYRMSMSELPTKKVWDKEKYLELRRKRVKAERILRAALKLGAFETDIAGSGRLNFQVQDYINLIDNLAQDQDPDPEIMQKLAIWITAECRYRWRYNNPEDVFRSIRDLLRDSAYKLTKTYTYEPFDDGRHSAKIVGP